MGKRKERRLAAMIAAGRRVKLDLFAEPSGESGGSSAQDELGGDIDPIHRAGSPNSPSSSGKQLENPLSLLGQYSDDELDDESSETLEHDTAEKSTADDNEQAKAPVGTERENLENNAIIDQNPQNDQQHDLEKRSISVDRGQNLEHNVAREIDSPVTATGDLGKELVPMEETSVPGASDVQPIDNIISNWKVVLHEESNQYYYWNTASGETSWVVPDVLVRGTDLSGEQKTAPDAEGGNIALAGEQEQKSSVDVELNSAVTMDATEYCKAGNAVHESEDIYEAMNETEEQSDRYKDKDLENNKQGPDANQTEMKISSGAASVLYHKTSSLQGNVSSWESSDTFFGNGTTAGADSEKNIWNQMLREENDSENDLTSVLKYGESLLERLKSLKRNNVQGHDWLSKYILEVEIRLSDIRSLLPFGSSLLPFWIHCERQLKELEGALDIEVSHYSKSAQTVEAELPCKSCESEGNEIKEDENEKGISSSAFDTSLASADVGMLKVGQNDLKELAADSNAPFTAHASVIDYPSSHSGSTAGKNNGVHEAAQNTELAPKAMLDAGEDVDMDVDMEVEDSTPVSATVTQDSLSEKCFAPQEQLIQPHPPAEMVSFLAPEAFPVPPPPDEEWIPPPPPDNELIPPPPPDDPIEPSYLPPPTYSETVPAVSYTEPYNMSYPGSNFEYYGQANTQFLGNNAFPHAEGCQVAVPHPLYYEALASTYPVSAPGVVNPVEPAAYYEVQDGAVFAGPVVNGAQSSVQHIESGHDALGSDRIRSTESYIEEGYTSFSDPGVSVSVVNGSTEKTPTEASVATATIQAPSTSSVAGNTSGSSTTTGAIAAKLAVPNAQSKVSRSKKRTVAVSSTLRSNKKVSSLVDKWKAAKEELQEEEEDEPENAYEILEKKRQREIEEWRAQQIASGEAKDNANFQPLGGDWRERVKRKRAQLNNEAAQTHSGAVTDGNQQPDLTELARDLPSGWQAYWDESSKQVYYGNVITSETTWTRPVAPK